MLERPHLAPPTTSCGRLFDAAAALLGLRPTASYEGQAAMELEALVQEPRILAGGWTLADGVLDVLPLLARLAEPGDARTGAELFHGTLIDGLSHWLAWAAEHTGIRRVALAGGCFLNGILCDGLAARLTAAGITPLLARAVPSNDGGLSLGQAWVALHHAAEM
jgi:hydrogenase maturation protein HypF